MLQDFVTFFLQFTIDAGAHLNRGHASKAFDPPQPVKGVT
jgi:hypothetical protein